MDVHGNVDLISKNQVTGWAWIKGMPDNKLVVTVEIDGKPVASAKASSLRRDLVEANISDGACAFFIDIPPEQELDVNKAIVMVTDEKTGAKKQLDRISKRMSEKTGRYQSFNDQKGDSDSFAKLEALRLPLSLAGCSVLDIGCNEGFFCLEALRRGARRVVGIDSDELVIKRARQRNPEIEFVHATWWDIPKEQFDFIFFFSAIHYEKEQKKLLRYLSEHLTENGQLILECGVYPGIEKKWNKIYRDDGYVAFPSMPLLKEELLADFAVSFKGSSVDQTGDPVPRYVFHCSKRKSTILVIDGKSGDGKTYLASLLAQKNIAVYTLDSFFYQVKSMRLSMVENDIIFKRIYEECDLNRIDVFIDEIVNEGLAEKFAAKILEQLPREVDFIAMEGYIFQVEEVEKAMLDTLRKSGYVVWGAARKG